VCLSVLEQVPDNAERTRLQNIMVSELERGGEETESSTAYCAHCGKPFTPANRVTVRLLSPGARDCVVPGQEQSLRAG
jgi:hypothetical protein